MLHHKLLLAAYAVFYALIEESEEFLLPRHVQTCQYRDVMLELGAEHRLCAGGINE